jgi:DNA-binding transcriptional LysR family regulator
VTVAQELHFGRAAQRLHLTGPALSQHVASLERDFGVQLFHRTPRGVTLTHAGERLLQRAPQLLQATDELRSHVLAIQPPLRIAVLRDLGPGPELLAAFAAENSGGAVALSELTSDRQLAALVDGTVDVAICHVPGRLPAGLAATLIQLDPMQAIVHPDSAEPDDHVSAGTLIFGLDEDEQTWRVWNDYARALAGAVGAITVTEPTAGSEFAVMSPMTIAQGHARIVPLSACSRNIAGLVRRAVVDPRPVYTWSLVHRRDDDNPQTRNFRRCAERVVDEQGWLRPHHLVWIPPYDIHSSEVAEINRQRHGESSSDQSAAHPDP